MNEYCRMSHMTVVYYCRIWRNYDGRMTHYFITARRTECKRSVCYSNSACLSVCLSHHNWLDRTYHVHQFIFSFFFTFLFIPCSRLFLLHVKYTVSYAIVYITVSKRLWNVSQCLLDVLRPNIVAIHPQQDVHVDDDVVYESFPMLARRSKTKHCGDSPSTVRTCGVWKFPNAC